jgi:uncharacterized protein (DUF488 family)
LLHNLEITALADVRRFPGSRRLPHFNEEPLRHSLTEIDIEYHAFRDLGGRRQARADSHNTAWRSPSFRGYADYMETKDFDMAMNRLIDLANRKRTAIMCAEALWWRCHRSLTADWLKAHGWIVTHIVGPGKLDEHPYTSAARIVDGRLNYRIPVDATLFD